MQGQKSWADFAYDVGEPQVRANSDEQLVLAMFDFLGAPFVRDDEVRVFLKSIAMGQWLESVRVLGRDRLEDEPLYRPLLDTISAIADYKDSDFAVDADAKWLPNEPDEIYEYFKQTLMADEGPNRRSGVISRVRQRIERDRGEMKLLRTLRTLTAPLLNEAAKTNEDYSVAEEMAVKFSTILVGTASIPKRALRLSRQDVRRGAMYQQTAQEQMRHWRELTAIHLRLALGLGSD